MSLRSHFIALRSAEGEAERLRDLLLLMLPQKTVRAAPPNHLRTPQISIDCCSACSAWWVPGWALILLRMLPRKTVRPA